MRLGPIDISFSKNVDDLQKRIVSLEESQYNIRPSLERAMLWGYDYTKVAKPKIPYAKLYELVELSDVLTNIINSLTNEIFRNGWEFEEAFESKCEKCGTEYEYKTDTCKEPNCGGATFEPDPMQIKELEKDFQSVVNLNGQSLTDLCKILNKDMEIADDMYMLLLNDYIFGDMKLITKMQVREMIRVPPELVNILADNTGTPGRTELGEKLFVCPEHRFKLMKLPVKDWESIKTTQVGGEDREYIDCKMCGRAAYAAHFEIKTPASMYTTQGGQFGSIYFTEFEIIHKNKYRQSLLYGSSKVITVWDKAVALIYIDRYIKEWFIRGRAKGIPLIGTSNTVSLKEAWHEKEEKLKKDPHDNSPIAVESAKGGRMMGQWLRTQETPTELGLVELRNQYRREMGPVWGVMPIFMGDLSQSGGLNNEGMQITVENRSTAFGQSIWNEDVYPRLMKIFGVTHWKLKLKPSEERDEMAELQRFAQKITNAGNMRAMGFTVTMTDDGKDFIFSGAASEPSNTGITGEGEEPTPRPRKPDTASTIGARFEGTPARKALYDLVTLPGTGTQFLSITSGGQRYYIPVSSTLSSYNEGISKSTTDYQNFFRMKSDEAEKVGWMSKDMQENRFMHLAKVFRDENPEVLDVGAGLGGFYTWCQKNDIPVRYMGYEVVPEYVKHAQEKSGVMVIKMDYRDMISPYDYVVCSGTFNYTKKDMQGKEPTIELIKSLEFLWSKTNKGLAFNFFAVPPTPDYVSYDYYAINKAVQQLTDDIEIINNQGNEYTFLLWKDSAMTSSTSGANNPTYSPKKERINKLATWAEDYSNEVLKSANSSLVRKADDALELAKLLDEEIFGRKFEGLSKASSEVIKEEIIEGLVEKKSATDIIKKIHERTYVDEKQIETIVQTETQHLQNKMKEDTFKMIDDKGEALYKWINPIDSRTTEVCKNIVKKTAKGVKMEELKRIIKEEGERFGFDTRELTPHINCRSTFQMVL